MRTSLNKIQEIERHLDKTMSPEECIVFQTRLLLDNELADDVRFQQKLYLLIKQNGRENLKAELEHLHQKLLADPERKSFWENIRKIFN